MESNKVLVHAKFIPKKEKIKITGTVKYFFMDGKLVSQEWVIDDNKLLNDDGSNLFPSVSSIDKKYKGATGSNITGAAKNINGSAFILKESKYVYFYQSLPQHARNNIENKKILAPRINTILVEWNSEWDNEPKVDFDEYLEVNKSLKDAIEELNRK